MYKVLPDKLYNSMYWTRVNFHVCLNGIYHFQSYFLKFMHHGTTANQRETSNHREVAAKFGFYT